MPDSREVPERIRDLAMQLAQANRTFAAEHIWAG